MGRACSFALAAAVLVAVVEPHASISTARATNCPAANPYDTQTDQVALQACFDAFDWILLEPEGEPG